MVRKDCFARIGRYIVRVDKDGKLEYLYLIANPKTRKHTKVPLSLSAAQTRNSRRTLDSVLR